MNKQLFRLLLLCVFSNSILLNAHAETNIIQRYHDKLLNLPFITIPAGQFVMGTVNLKEAQDDIPPNIKDSITDETPAHTVIFEKSFRLSQTEITQKTWLTIMGNKPGPKFHWKHDDWEQLPVVSVSWYDVQDFIEKINKQSSNITYRLPTEAEWEYAARAGSNALRPFSQLGMDEYAWFIHNSNDEVQPVAQLEPNEFGLYDMYGNVWEWMSDWYHRDTYKNSAKINPQGPNDGTKKIRRGGSFHCPPHMIRPAYRASNYTDDTLSILGFRLVSEKR